MPTIIALNNTKPSWGKDCFIADNATLIGDIEMGDYCSVWFQAVVRGDVNSIRIGSYTNIQDGAVLHATYQQAALTIGNRVSIGHRAIVHGCTLHDNVLIGMGAIVMDHAVVESNCIIAAGAVVTEHTKCLSGGIYVGVPAKRIKEITPELAKGQIDRICDNYLLYSSWYHADK
jgi:carbonic anhydrase/acetyltransferase-like protein (isoleucine patch superfamily)